MSGVCKVDRKISVFIDIFTARRRREEDDRTVDKKPVRFSDTL